MVVFFDTSAIYALANTADANHQRAVQCLRAAMDAGEDLLVHNDILVESSALLHRRLGWAVVSRFLHEASAFQLRWVDEVLHRSAAERFLKRKGRASLVDEVSFRVIREAGAHSVLAFDQGFVREGFTPYPL